MSCCSPPFNKHHPKTQPQSSLILVPILIPTHTLLLRAARGQRKTWHQVGFPSNHDEVRVFETPEVEGALLPGDSAFRCPCPHTLGLSEAQHIKAAFTRRADGCHPDVLSFLQCKGRAAPPGVREHSVSVPTPAPSATCYVTLGSLNQSLVCFFRCKQRPITRPVAYAITR